MNIEREIERILAEGNHVDPRLGAFGETLFHEGQIRKEALPRYGIVSDNKDPLCLGRVRAACDGIAPGAVTPWIPVIRSYASGNAGFWYLPDIGSQVLLGFIGNNIGQPFVLGCVFNLKQLPPKHSTENPSKSIVMQSKKHRLEIIDEEGKENLIISSVNGQMRYEMSKEKGIQIINELGGINIKCRKLKIESEKEVSLQAEKKLTITTDDAVSIKSKKKTVLQNDKEVKVKGKCVKLQASQGITAEGKQLAAEGNQVMGFDIHNMEVPSGKGTTTVPLPHPYIGKLADKLSEDVKINGHNAAVKGSKSKHDDAMHNQLPGTVKFTKNPNKEGEVTGGTAAKVKINGKEAAVIGSTVTTCNDMGMKENSTILAPGAGMPMPVIINPKNMEAYQTERAEQETRKPEFTTLKWNKTKVKEGEELELSAQVKDIEDGSMITFQVWRDGQDPNSHVPQGKIPAAVEGGTAKVLWHYTLPSSTETIPEQNPAFFFSAHSAWCLFKESESAEVELKRPELNHPVWKDQDGNDTSKGLAGETLKLCVDCNADMEEGAGVAFVIYDSNKEYIDECSGENKGGKAEAEWVYRYEHDPKNPLTEKPKFLFKAKANHGVKTESGEVEIGQKLYVEIVDLLGNPLKETEYTLHLPDETIEDKTGEDGIIEKEDLIPGMYSIVITQKNMDDVQFDLDPTRGEKIVLVVKSISSDISE